MDGSSITKYASGPPGHSRMWETTRGIRNINLISSVLIPVLLGLSATGAAIVVTALGLKYILGAICMVVGASILLSLRSSHSMLMSLVAALALSLPLNLDVNLLFRYHIGGAASISISATTLLIVAIYAVLIYQHVTGQRGRILTYRPILVWATLLYMAAGILSLVNARFIDLAGLELLRVFTLLLAMILIMSLDEERYFRTFVFFLSLAVLLESVLAAVQYFGHTSLGLDIFGEQSLVSLNIGPTVTRATGTIGHPNELSYFFEISIPLMYALFLGEDRGLFKAWYFCVLGAACIGIFTTTSRGAWATVPISTFLVFSVLYLPRIASLKSAVNLFAAGCLLSVGLFFAAPTIIDRLFHDDYRSAATRMPLNYATLSIIAQYPYLGVGLNNFSEVFHLYDTTGKSAVFTTQKVEGGEIQESDYKHVVHNLYLWVWAEVGTIGFAAFLWIFISAFYVARTAYTRAPPWQRAVLVGAVSGLIAHLLHGMIDPGFRITPTVSNVIYCLFGLIGAISMTAGRDDESKTTTW